MQILGSLLKSCSWVEVANGKGVIRSKRLQSSCKLWVLIQYPFMIKGVMSKQLPSKSYNTGRFASIDFQKIMVQFVFI